MQVTYRNSRTGKTTNILETEVDWAGASKPLFVLFGTLGTLVIGFTVWLLLTH